MHSPRPLQWHVRMTEPHTKLQYTAPCIDPADEPLGHPGCHSPSKCMQLHFGMHPGKKRPISPKYTVMVDLLVDLLLVRGEPKPWYFQKELVSNQVTIRQSSLNQCRQFETVFLIDKVKPNIPDVIRTFLPRKMVKSPIRLDR